MEIFDEDKAVEFILNKLNENSSITKKYTQDDILEVIDIIWDYYEENGMLDLSMADDDSEEDSIDIDKLTAHVIKMAKKDRHTNLEPLDIPAIVEAELAYEETLDD